MANKFIELLKDSGIDTVTLKKGDVVIMRPRRSLTVDQMSMARMQAMRAGKDMGISIYVTPHDVDLAVIAKELEE